MEAIDHYLEIRWNWVISSLLKLTNSTDMVYAKPPTCLRKNGHRDGEGVIFFEYINRHVGRIFQIFRSLESISSCRFSFKLSMCQILGNIIQLFTSQRNPKTHYMSHSVKRYLFDKLL